MFIYPELHHVMKRKVANKLQQNDTLMVTIRLLLSEDIHPCSGPALKEGTATTNSEPNSQTQFMLLSSVNKLTLVIASAPRALPDPRGLSGGLRGWDFEARSSEQTTWPATRLRP